MFYPNTALLMGPNKAVWGNKEGDSGFPDT